MSLRVVREHLVTLLPALAALCALSGAASRPLVRSVAPGVELLQQIVPPADPEGPLVVNVLRIDPSAPGVRIEAALGQDVVWGSDPTFGREAVSRLAARRGAVAAINAGFFPFAGNPIGLHVEQGDLVTEPTLRRTALLFPATGAPRCAAFNFAATVSLAEASRPLHGLNRRPGRGDELLLFTPRFAAATLPVPGRVEAIVEGVPSPLKPGIWTGSIRAMVEGGAAPLAPGTLVLSGGGASADFLRERATPGTPVRLQLEMRCLDDPGLDPAAILQAVTGAPRIVAEGRIDIRLDAERLRTPFSQTRHPRTAVGITADGKLLWMTIDGRQSLLSRGATLAETAQWLIRFGAVEGLNLDGGDSTTAVVQGGVVNTPSEGAERPVADALLLFAERSASHAAAWSLNGPPRPLRIGERYAFSLPAGVDPQTALWGVTGGAGFIGQDGVFVALRPGLANVRLDAGGGQVSVPVRVASPGIKSPASPS